jgi:hypothetical protein
MADSRFSSRLVRARDAKKSAVETTNERADRTKAGSVFNIVVSGRYAWSPTLFFSASDLSLDFGRRLCLTIQPFFEWQHSNIQEGTLLTKAVLLQSSRPIKRPVRLQ